MAEPAAARPGVVHDLPIEQYHADITSISKSGLDDISRSPWHFWKRHLAPDRPPAAEPTPSMFIGTLGHCAVLEPEAFASRYVVGPDVHHSTKAWKEFVASLAASQAPITQAQRDAALAQSLAVRAHPEIGRLLAAGRPEVTARWKDGLTGMLCRCRPDWVWPVGSEGVILLDLKTCQDAGATGFARSVANYRYHVQQAFYMDGYEQASGMPVLGFVFAAVESAYPYACAAYMLAEEDVELGRRAYRRNLDVYAHCMRTGEWPGYPDSVQPLYLPRWATFEGETAR